MKRLLIVARDFPPCALIAAQRSLRLARDLSKFGWVPYVLTASRRCQIPVDGSFGQDVLSSIPIETRPCWSIWRHTLDWRSARPWWRWLLGLAGRTLDKLFIAPWIPIDGQYPWVTSASRRGASMVRRHHIDLIWATTPPLSSLYLGRRISRRTGVPYVVDFRDVRRWPPRSEMPRQLARSFRAEEEVLRDAIGLTHVAPRQAEILTEHHAFLRDKPRCLAYNCFDRTEIEIEKTTFDRPTIIHGGSLYGGMRRIGGFLAAVSRLRSGDAETSGNLLFIQYGTDHGDGAYLARGRIDHGLGDGLRAEAQLPRMEFLKHCRGAAILLLVVGHNTGIAEHADAIPGKLYDYFAACRPILVIGPEGCEAGKMVARANRGIALDSDDADRIAQAIELLLEGRGESGELDLSLDAVREFDAETVVGKMADFFSSLVERGTRTNR